MCICTLLFGDVKCSEECGWALGLEEDHLASSLLGKDLVGYLEEELAGIYSLHIYMAIHTTRVQCSHIECTIRGGEDAL
jgi:hypothetical protein